MPTNTLIDLPVRALERSRAFFAGLGHSFSEQRDQRAHGVR